MKLTHKIFTGLFAAATMVGCDKKLDQRPQQSIDAATALTTPADVESAVVGAYSIIAGGALYGTNLNMLPELLAANPSAGATSADRYCTWSGTFTGPRQVYNKNMTRDNSEASRTWIAGYRAINMANTVISALGVVTDATQKNTIEGEALWIRAIMHFEMVRIFALPYDAAVTNNSQLGVPIMTVPTKTEADAFKYPARNTVQQVYDAVIADLNSAIAKLPTNNGTRANKSTAQAFLARVYLQKGDYANALNQANLVIASNKYKLNASVLATFTNKNSAESIFEIQQNDQNNAGIANDGMATFFASLPGIGRADVRVTTGFVGLYPTSDLRRSEWYYIGTGARPGNTYCGKWRTFSQNLPIIRLTEMYLIRAECNLRLSTTTGATPASDLAQVVNTVRTGTTAPATPVLADVLLERRLELAFEGLRIHDIRRLKGTVGARQWNDNALVFPIPQRDIDANSSLVQNPGY
jgi:tetratricopeptide (TPR) repeat protein